MVTTHSLLILDIYLIMRNPFYSRNKRERRFLVIISFTIFIICPYVFYFTVHNDVGLDLYHHLRNSPIILLQKILMIVICSITGITALLVIIRLGSQGTSSDLKEKIYKRHIAYFGFYYLMIGTIMAKLFLYNSDNDALKLLNGGIYYMATLPIAFLRLYEPYVI